MSADIREYLIERFRTDADALRQRAITLRASTAPTPGPDAALSSAMALACDDVASLAETLPESASLEDIIQALDALLPELANRANSAVSVAAPAVKSVYVGASTRVRELIAAETRSFHTSGNSGANGEVGEDDAHEDDDE